MSRIAGEPILINPLSQPEAPEADDGPKSTPTPATEWAPKGHIVDDSARGTIFWEAETSETEQEDEEVNSGSTPDNSSGGSSSSSSRNSNAKGPAQEAKKPSKTGQDWGKPFQVEWLSTNRLPFYRTRGLRNPWNVNREVKIARDGTELEPGIGRRLVQMFHRPVIPLVPQGQGIPPMQMPMPPY